MQSTHSGIHDGVYTHLAGQITKGAVLDVGLKCTHSCSFCYYSFLDGTNNQFQGMRRASFRTLDECKRIIKGLHDNGFLNFDYTGGEPSLHPNIVELTHYAHRELGLRGRMITLGQFLMRKLPSCKSGILIEELLEAGLTNFLFSTHAVNEPLFKKITGESWERLHQAMTYLDQRDFYYTSNTTVFEWNFEHLEEIAAEVLKHKIYMHNFIIMNAYYEWNRDGRAFGVQARYTDIYPHLKRAIDMLEANDVAVNIRYAPLCTMPGFEKNVVGGVGVRYDAYEWMNKAGHVGGDPEFCSAVLDMDSSGVDTDWIYQEEAKPTPEVFARRGSVKIFPPTCSTCLSRSACDGVDPNYLKTHGSSELRPYHDEALVGPVALPRRRYLPAFQVKWDQSTNMKAVMTSAFASARANTAMDVSEARVAIIAPHPTIKNLQSQTVKPSEMAGAEILVKLDESVTEVSRELVELVHLAFLLHPTVDVIYSDWQRRSEAGGVAYGKAGEWNRAALLRKDLNSPLLAVRSKAAGSLPLTAGQSHWATLLAAHNKNLSVMWLGQPLVTLAQEPATPVAKAVRSDAKAVLANRALYSNLTCVWALVVGLLSLLPFSERLITALDPRAGKRIPLFQGQLNLGQKFKALWQRPAAVAS